MADELNELITKVETFTIKLQKLEKQLTGITIGIAILFLVMVVIAFRISIGG